jgi:hypothetical protein
MIWSKQAENQRRYCDEFLSHRRPNIIALQLTSGDLIARRCATGFPLAARS